jgi:hypothetical protein
LGKTGEKIYKWKQCMRDDKIEKRERREVKQYTK